MVPQPTDALLIIAATILAGSAVGVPPYTVIALYIWWEGRRRGELAHPPEYWLLRTPVLVACFLCGLVFLRGLFVPNFTATIGIAFWCFLLVNFFGYGYVGIIVLGARLCRVE